jgi:outer membrane cobalamin receptor
MKNGCFLLLIFISIQTFSQNNSLNLYNLNFEELSKLKIVSASKSEQSIAEIPNTIRVINSEDFKTRGYFTLEEVLADLPGFQFRNIQGINSYVFQRGITNQNNLTLVLIDGVQLNELNSGGFYAGGQYNLSNIERIEVVYGPSSVAWGTNAISGIINIITKGNKGKQIEINATGGNFNTLEENIAINWQSKENDFKIRLTGMVKNTEKANLKGAEGDFNWTDKMDNFENDYNIGIKVEANDFILGTNFLQKEASTATMQKSVGTNYRDYGTSWNIRFVNSYLKYDKQLSPKTRFTSTLYNRNSTVLKNTIYSVLDTAQVGYYRPNNLIGFENILNYKYSKRLVITSGFITEYENLAKSASLSYSSSANEKPPVPLKPLVQNNYLASVFIEPNIMLFNNLILSGGLRFDLSSIYSTALTPRLGASYNLGKYIARLSYAEAFRAPKPWDYTDGMGNPNLLPEKMRSVEVNMGFMATKYLKFELIGYRNRLTNGIIKETVGDKYRWGNTGVINTMGTELSVIFNTERLNAYLNYTFTQSSDGKDLPIFEISPNMANFGFTYFLHKNWSLNIRANYSGKRQNPKIINTTKTDYVDPYLIFNGAVTYSNQKGLTVQLIGKNLLDAEYYHTSNRQPDRYRQPQRMLMMHIGYNFKL